MPCPPPHNHYSCLLFSPACLPHLLICTCLISSPTARLPSSVLCWYHWCFFIFATCYISLRLWLGCLCAYFLFRFYFCVIPCDCYNSVLSPWPSLCFFHAIYVSDLIPLPHIFDGVGMIMMKHVCVFVVLIVFNLQQNSSSSAVASWGKITALTRVKTVFISKVPVQ